MKIKLVHLLFILIIASVILTGCDASLGGDDTVTEYTDRMESSTGTWRLLDDDGTYFVFDGAESAMTFSYYEDGALKYSGKFRAIRRTSPDARTPLTYIITRSDKEAEDWLSCYLESPDESFTQFSIKYGEEDLGVTDGTVYTHVYRPSEMPYKVGTYVLDTAEYKPYSKSGFDDGVYRIPEGTYVTAGGQSLAVFPVMNESFSLFRYTNGDTVVEGIFNIAEDRKTVYLYIEHDIYEKVREADKGDYDTTFSINYPPDFYLRGDFDTSSNSIIINGLYHHPSSPTELEDSLWVYGTYDKQ